MNREAYIYLLNNNNILSIVYEFYCGECTKKNETPIEPPLFALAFPMWEHHIEVINMVRKHYDKIHDPRQLIRNNRLIKFI